METSSFPTPNKVRTEAKAMSSQILEDWRKLQKIVELHQEVIAKRWTKKTKTKQKEILLREWPNMAPEHRPDWEALRRERTGKYTPAELLDDPDAYIFPYINLEDLCSKSLLVFVESPGRNSPSAFARSDVQAMHLGSVAHTIKEPCFLEGHALYLDGDTLETYGKLVNYDEDPKVIDLMYTQRQFTPGEGLRAFEIKQRIYPFLIKVCELILHDLVEASTLYDAPKLDDTAPHVIPEVGKLEISPHSSSPDGGEFLPTLASIAAEAPYRLPATLDFNRIRTVVSAKRSASEGHLWSLREDPGYFSETVMDWGEHRNDRLLDSNGDPHPTGPHTRDFWERVVRNIIADAYSGFMNWDLLLRFVDRLIVLQNTYKDQISYENELPHEFLICLLQFRQILQISCEAPIFRLRNIQSSPPLRSHFYREPQWPGTANMSIQPRNPSSPHFHKPWGLLLLMWDPTQRNLLGLPNIIDAFEQLMQDPKERKNLSPHMLDIFSDLIVLTKCINELDNYQPWGATFDEMEEKYQNDVRGGAAKEARYQVDFMEQMDDVLRRPETLTPYAMTDKGRFNYPINKGRTKQTTEATIDASMGDQIWSYQGKKPARTEPWVEAIKKEKVNTGVIDNTFKDAKEWTTTEEDKNTERKQKVKVKTKGASKPLDSQLPSPPTESKPSNQSTDQPPSHVQFKLSPRGMKVINTLFFVPNRNDPPGEIPWADFLQVMVATGFSIQKLYGSIWQFNPPGVQVQRSIQFHEPHPGVKIPFLHARRMGRRLGRVSGWDERWFSVT